MTDDNPMEEVEKRVEEVIAAAPQLESPAKTMVEAKHTRGEWLNPLNRMIWQKTFLAKNKTMTLRNGQKFNLTYEDRSGRMVVWVQIDRDSVRRGFDSFTPCGWFDYEQVTSKEWITSG